MQQVLLAGSFGSYLAPGSAIRLGLVPPLPVMRVVSAGNVAGEGAKMALLSLRERAGAMTLLEEVNYVELSDRADFNDRFVDQLAFPAESPVAVIACGALAAQARLAAHRSGLPAEVHSLSALLHNRPSEIGPAVEALARRLAAEGKSVVVAYADCGTYGALDEICGRLGLERLGGLHCYDVLAGEKTVARLLDDEPGTYLLTDFLLRGFRRLVVAGLGLDRHPELVADYFANYRHVVWLAEQPTPELEVEAGLVAELLGLRLEVHFVGDRRVQPALVTLVRSARR